VKIQPVSHRVKTQRLLHWRTSQCKRHHYWKDRWAFIFFRICSELFFCAYVSITNLRLSTNSMPFQYLMDQSKVFDGVFIR